MLYRLLAKFFTFSMKKFKALASVRKGKGKTKSLLMATT